MASQRKIRRSREPRDRILVVTEGTTTEKQYVEGLLQFLRSEAVTVSVKTAGVGKDPGKVVRKCVELRDEAKRAKHGFDQCICLVDVDQHGTLDDAITTARREGIHLLVSRLKFEVWLLWHVSESRAVRTSGQLDQLMVKHKLFEVSKRLDRRFPFERVDDAVRTAYAADPDLCSCRTGPDPSSGMPVLVQILRGDDSPGIVVRG